MFKSLKKIKLSTKILLGLLLVMLIAVIGLFAYGKLKSSASTTLPTATIIGSITVQKPDGTTVTPGNIQLRLDPSGCSSTEVKQQLTESCPVGNLAYGRQMCFIDSATPLPNGYMFKNVAVKDSAGKTCNYKVTALGCYQEAGINYCPVKNPVVVNANASGAPQPLNGGQVYQNAANFQFQKSDTTKILFGRVQALYGSKNRKKPIFRANVILDPGNYSLNSTNQLLSSPAATAKTSTLGSFQFLNRYNGGGSISGVKYTLKALETFQLDDNYPKGCWVPLQPDYDKDNMSEREVYYQQQYPVNGPNELTLRNGWWIKGTITNNGAAQSGLTVKVFKGYRSGFSIPGINSGSNHFDPIPIWKGSTNSSGEFTMANKNLSDSQNKCLFKEILEGESILGIREHVANKYLVTFEKSGLGTKAVTTEEPTSGYEKAIVKDIAKDTDISQLSPNVLPDLKSINDVSTLTKLLGIIGGLPF